MFEVRKTGNSINVFVSEVIPKDENSVVLGGVTLFEQIYVGPKELAKKKLPDRPALILTPEQAGRLGRLLIAESKGN